MRKQFISITQPYVVHSTAWKLNKAFILYEVKLLKALRDSDAATISVNILCKSIKVFSKVLLTYNGNTTLNNISKCILPYRSAYPFIVFLRPYTIFTKYDFSWIRNSCKSHVSIRKSLVFPQLCRTCPEFYNDVMLQGAIFHLQLSPEDDWKFSGKYNFKIYCELRVCART